MTREPRIALALDSSDWDQISAWAAELGPRVGALKIGLEGFLAFGPRVLDLLAPHAPIFLDLKLHDIPNTVEKAVLALRGRGVRYLTVHTSGGRRMLEAARQAAADEIHLLGVTVLTSLAEEDLQTLGFAAGVEASTERLADLAAATDLSGVVCSPRELARLRPRFASPFRLVTPGIRPLGADSGDQKRTATPARAVAAGASLLVIGRPVLAAPDPLAALLEIIASLPEDQRTSTGSPA